MGWLLDTQPTQSHVLREQVTDLYTRRVSNPKQLDQAKRDTNKLEEEGRRLLELNDRLRDDLRKQRDGASKNIVPGSHITRFSTFGSLGGYEMFQFFRQVQKNTLNVFSMTLELYFYFMCQFSSPLIYQNSLNRISIP